MLSNRPNKEITPQKGTTIHLVLVAAGIPAISTPINLSRYRTPIGIQFAGPSMSDECLIGLVREFQQKWRGQEVSSQLLSGII